MKRFSAPAVLVAGALSISISANAQTPDGDDPPIDQIIVVANKSARSIRDIAANVTVVSRDQLDHEMANSIADLLRYSPGIDYESAGTRFGTEGVNIRGIGGNRVALLVDGVPLNDQFDVGSFSNATRDFVNAGFVQELEVLHGPASALYGSSAIGGVVAMRTVLPPDLAAGASHGGRLTMNWRESDSSLNGTALQVWNAGATDILVGLSLRDGEENNPATAQTRLDQRDYERRSAILKIVTDDRLGNTWQVGYYRQASAVLSSLRSMLGSGRFRSTTALDGDDDHSLNLLSAEYQFGGSEQLFDSGIARAYVGDASIRQRTLDERGNARRPVSIDRLFDFEQDVRGAELNLQKTFDGLSVTHRVGLGAEFRQRTTEEFRDGLETGLIDGQQTNVLLGESFPLRDFPISRSTDWGVYIEDSMSVGDWTVIAALRADRYELDPTNDRVYREDFPFAPPVSLSESELSPKLGLVYRTGQSVDVYLQYTHGFRAAPFEDANIGLEIPTFNVRAIPNPDLRAESSDGFDVGIRWEGESGRAHLSAFRTNYDDFIESKVRLGLDPESGRILFQSQNIQSARIEGIEAGWSISLEPLLTGLSFSGSLHIARGKNRDTNEYLNSVGPPQAVLGFEWASFDGGWTTTLRSTITDSWTKLDTSRGDLFQPPSYVVFDLFAAKRLSDRTTLRAGLLNLTDREYWIWSAVRSVAPDDPIVPHLGMPGRSMTLGIDMRW